MMDIWVLAVLACCFVHVQGNCKRADWSDSFNGKGLSTCERSRGIRGFWRKGRRDPDSIESLEEAVCCSRARVYSWVGNFKYVDWDFKGNSWVSCPTGYFLQGIWRNDGKDKLGKLDEGRCWKPATHPYRYGQCKTQDISTSFDDEGLSQCSANYFVVSLYRSSCDRLHCLDKLKCCKMASSPDVLNSLDRVKTRVMDITLYYMALLARYLGYSKTYGCRAPHVGEDFNRNGDSWEADRRGGCDGTRLSIKYGHWSFAVKDILYGSSVITEMEPQSVDTGYVVNQTPTKAFRQITRTDEVVRSVTHTTTSSWSQSSTLGVEVSYTPPDSTGGVGGSVSYTFEYSTSTSTTDSEDKTQTRTFSTIDSKELEPYTSVAFDLRLFKTRTTVPYTATIIAKFSAELRGNLQKKSGNYHHKYRGSKNRKSFNYRFGDESTAFYEDLKYKSSTQQLPWLWADILSNFGSAQLVIDRLVKESKYEFTLTGKFEDVMGYRTDITWSTPTSLGSGQNLASGASTYNTRTVNLGSHKTVAKPQQRGDPAPDNPPAPRVVLMNREINEPEPALGGDQEFSCS